MKHILFDLDGTLIDSAPSILSCFARVLNGRGVKPKCELTKSLIGPPLLETLKIMSDIEDEGVLRELVNDFKTFYDDVGYREAREYPGISDVLRTLNTNGSILYVVTNKRVVPAKKILAHLGWTDLFEGLYSQDAFVPALKSKAIVIQNVLRLNKIKDSTAVYVGDREEDREAAKKNGIAFFGVDWGYGEWTSSDRINRVRQPVELLAI